MKLKKISNKNSSVVVSRILRSSTLAKRLSFESSKTKDLTHNMESKKKKKSKMIKRRKVNGSKLLHNKTVKSKQHKKMNNAQTIENIKLAPIFEKASVTIKENKKIEPTESSPIIYHGESFSHLIHCHIQQLCKDFPEIENLENKFDCVAVQEYESISPLGWTGLLGITDIIKKETLADINKQNNLQNVIMDLSDCEDFISAQKSQSCKRKKKHSWRTNGNIQKISRKKKSSNNEVIEIKKIMENEINKLWVEKHRPEKSENVIDNSKAIEKLKEWLNYWKDKSLESASKSDKGDDDDDYELSNDSELDISNCTIIFGPSGAGKTNLVYCLAQELGFRVFEVNASSTRSGRQVTAQLREATQSHHVEGKVLTLDELLIMQAEKMKTIGPSKVKKKKFNTIKDFWNGSLSPEDFKTSKSFTKKSKSYKSTKLQFNNNFKKLDDDSEISIIENSKKEEKNGLSDKILHNKGLSISSLSVILFDDVDVIFEEDEGFWSAVNAFLRTTKKPVILTASTSLHSIKHNVNLPYELITLELPTVESMCNHLINICQKENLKFGQDKIQQIISYVGCDIRKSLLLLQYWYYAPSKNTNPLTSVSEIENSKYQNTNDKNSVFDDILGIKNKNNYFDLNEYLQNFVNIVYLAYSNNFSIIHNNLSQLITSLLIFEKSKIDNVLCQKSEETYSELKKETLKREKSETKNATITCYFQTTRKKNETTQLKISSLEAIADLADIISLSNVLMYPMEQNSQEYSAYNSSVIDTISYSEVLSLKNTLHKLQKISEELQEESKKFFFYISSEFASNHSFVKNDTTSELKYNDNAKCFNSLRKAIPPVTCLQKTAICTDYLSNVRNICKSEKLRQVQNSKRSGRFLHYLDSISLLLDKDIYYLLQK